MDEFGTALLTAPSSLQSVLFAPESIIMPCLRVTVWKAPEGVGNAVVDVAAMAAGGSRHP